MTRILVIQTAFIGDVILASSLLESIHSEHPDARIDLLVRKGNESLFKDHPYLNAVLIWDKKNGKYSKLFQLVRRIRAEHYDTVVNVQRFSASGILTVLSGAKKTIGFSKNPLSIFFSKRVPHLIDWQAENPLHEIERNHMLIADLVKSESPLRPKLYPGKEDASTVEALVPDRPFVCVAPASVWFTKQFPAEKWIEFIDAVEPEVEVLLLGAPSDATLADELIQKTVRTNIRSLCGKLNLLQSAALMKKARMNFVNDSAPMHLCSAVNAPVTAVYCSTIPNFGFGPLSDNSHVVETLESLNCRPCGLHGFKACPKGHFKCALSIRKEQLLQHL